MRITPGINVLFGESERPHNLEPSVEPATLRYSFPPSLNCNLVVQGGFFSGSKFAIGRFFGREVPDGAETLVVRREGQDQAWIRLDRH